MSYIAKRSQNPWFQVIQRLSRHKLAMTSFGFLMLLSLLCFGANTTADWLKVDPYADDLFLVLHYRESHFLVQMN